MPSYDRVRVFESPRSISDVDLVDTDVRQFRFDQLRGKVVLVFFGFTNCPDICPLTMSHWQDLERSERIDLEKVDFVLISVDGERDTPDVMKAYLKKFSNRFIGLTAKPETVKLLAKQFSAPFFKGNPTAHDHHYDVSHSSQSFVLDPSGALRAEMYSPSIDALAGTIGALLEEAANLGTVSD